MNLEKKNLDEKNLNKIKLEEKILLDLEKNPVLKTGFFEKENRGNNTFNFPENFLENSKIGKKIFIPGIKIGELSDLIFGDDKKIVFEDFDIDENGKEFLAKEGGFENFLWILNHKNNGEIFPPIFICDNHNHVLESWKFFKGKNTKLIHIDQHRDNGDYKKPILDFRRDLRICDYINYARDENWINKDYFSFCELNDFKKFFPEEFFSSNKIFLDSEKIFGDFEKKFLNKKDKIILNIDLDIFVKHQTMVNHKKIFEFIKFLKNRVDLISIASSPLFLKKEKVFGLIEKILK